MNETLKLLILILASIQIFDIILAIVLYYLYRKNSQYKHSIFLWIGMLMFCLSDAFLGKFSIKHVYFSYGFLYLSSLSLAQIVGVQFKLNIPYKKYSLFFVTSYFCSLCLYLAFSISLSISAALLSISITVPIFHTCYRAVKSEYEPLNSQTNKWLLCISILWGVHFFDYPLLRPLENLEFSIVGFSIVLLFTYITSILVPIVINHNLYLKMKVKLQNKLERAHTQVIARDKLASLGELSAGIAHEIKNPLNIIQNGALMSRSTVTSLVASHQKLEPNQQNIHRINIDKQITQLDKVLDMIERNITRIDNIVRGMLIHSRSGESELSQEHLAQLISDNYDFTLSSIKGKINLDIDIEYEIESNLIFNLYAQELGRALINIFENSLYALNEKSQSTQFTPKIKIKAYSLKDVVYIEITDNACGISDENLSKIFEPFFTTKDAGSGTGLGMSMAFDVAKMHGGSISVESRVGSYTQFTLTLSKKLK